MMSTSSSLVSVGGFDLNKFFNAREAAAEINYDGNDIELIQETMK